MDRFSKQKVGLPGGRPNIVEYPRKLDASLCHRRLGPLPMMLLTLMADKQFGAHKKSPARKRTDRARPERALRKLSGTRALVHLQMQQEWPGSTEQESRRA